jgi:hypothetical protein
MRRRAEEQAHPWARASAARCEAIVSLAPGNYHEPAVAHMLEATDEHERLEMQFDAARCRLALGRAQRRAKQWRAARETLEAAASAFGALGSEGWAVRARAELERVGGRQRGSGELTPERAPGCRAARGRTGQQGNCVEPVRHREHGRGAPRARVRKARGALPRAAGEPAGAARLTVSPRSAL